jgi:asparagine synthase (glutamine-hydrolysing)
MGYRKFFLFYAQEILRRRALSELPRLAMTLGSLPLGNLSKVRFLWRERRRYLPGKGAENIVEFPGTQAVGLGLGSTTTLFERQVLDATRLSLPTLLRYEDRNSGGNSIETRLPFVDHRVVEFGMALPTSSKLRLGRGKWILRSLLSRRGVKQIAWNRVKRGFDVNERKWLSLGLGDLLREAIRTRKASLAEVLPEDLDLDRAFSDARLLENHIAFTEAVSLIWLADRVQQRGASFPSTDAGLRAVSHSP